MLDRGVIGARRVVGIFGIVALLNAGIALALTLAGAAPGAQGTQGAAFVRYLVFSECIGLSITAWILLIRYVLPGLRRRGAQVNVAISMVFAAPLGYAVGYTAAAWWLGEPMRPGWWEAGRRLGLLATVLGAAGFTAFFWLRQRLLSERAAAAEAQRHASDAQLRLLRAQLEPHMLFNTLANLRALVDDDPALAQRMIDQLIVYLRSALAASRSESTTLQHEFAQLRAYLEIMSLRMGPRMSYRLVLPEALQGIAIPPMLLQPLVENAIRHGLEPKVGAGSIEVEARAAGPSIEIRVRDTGLGFPADVPDVPDAPDVPGGPDGPDGPVAPPDRAGRGSYGLVHVRERLQAVYGSSASLTLQRMRPQGVCATVRIPP